MLKPFFCTSLVLDVKTLFEKVASFTPSTFPPAQFTTLHAFPVLSYSGMLLALINSMDLLLVIRRYYSDFDHPTCIVCMEYIKDSTDYISSLVIRSYCADYNHPASFYSSLATRSYQIQFSFKSCIQPVLK